MIHYYKTPDGYVGITDEYPRGLKDVIFIGRGPTHGKGIDTVHEQAYSRRDLQGWTKVAKVPLEWREAIGLEESRTTELVIEWPWERLRQRILAKAGTPEHEQWKEERVPYIIITIIALVIAYWTTF
jgi:hypothetical protein